MTEEGARARQKILRCPLCGGGPKRKMELVIPHGLEENPEVEQALYLWCAQGHGWDPSGETTPYSKLADPCLARTSWDEPIFVLRAQDLTAPGTIEHWAETLEEIYQHLGEAPPESLTEKVGAARACAAMMREWSRRKVPD